MPKPKWKLEEALEFLNGPDFIPAASDPARIEFDGPRHFTFPTPRPCEFAENNIVYGRLYRCAERWQERPAIILLDGGRRRAAFEALDKTPFNLTSTRPAISKENVLLIEGMHDLLASSPVELWQSWGQPEIWRLPHGHISTALISLMPGLPGRILRWLAPRLKAGRKNNEWTSN